MEVITPLMFCGRRVGEQYRPIANIIDALNLYMSTDTAGYGCLGGFMTAVLDNDLQRACLRADKENAKNLQMIGQFLLIYGSEVIDKHNETKPPY